MRCLIVSVCVTVYLLGGVQSRSLQQQFSSASAVSVSGGSGPFGNCGSTSTTGNAQAFASGPPCQATIIPAPPPSTTCPVTTQVVEWAAGKQYPPITVCPGSSVQFKWNTASADVKYGLYQIPSATCPTSPTAPGVQLIITPASSPNPQGFVNTAINSPGTYYFTDLNNCAKGQLQQITISATAVAQAASG